MIEENNFSIVNLCVHFDNRNYLRLIILIYVSTNRIVILNNTSIVLGNIPEQKYIKKIIKKKKSDGNKYRTLKTDNYYNKEKVR